MATLGIVASAGASENVVSNDFVGKQLGYQSANRVGDIVESLGDLNGDGFDDFVTMVDGTSDRAAYVFFGPGRPNSAALADLPPDRGYRINAPGNAQFVTAIGDQNGDGLSDVAIGVSSIGAVLYGVADPATELPACGLPAQTRCLDTSNPVDVDGNRLGFSLSTPPVLWANRLAWQSGDINGDGKEEIVTTNVPSNAIEVFANGLGEDCPNDPGPCVITVGDLEAPDRVTIQGPSSLTAFGASGAAIVGDVNGDGLDDIGAQSGTDGSVPPAAWIVYGKEWDESPIKIDELSPTEGYSISAPFSANITAPFETGDVNADGIDDIGVQVTSLIPSQSTSTSVILGKEGTAARAGLTTSPPAAGDGFQFTWNSASLGGLADVGTNTNKKTVGDINGDGADEFVVTAPATTVDGKANAGRIMIFQSGLSEDQNVVDLNVTTPASEVLILNGDTAGLRLGSGISTAGDIDEDGVVDLAIGADGYALTSPAPVSNVGLLATLSTSHYYSQAETGVGTATGTDAAQLAGVGNANQRESVVYFEYGTSAQYGQETAEQSIGRSSAGRGFEAQISGLTPKTSYHYRAVIENDLGIKSYGADRTFTTADAPGPPPNPCQADPAAPGCDKYCEANPTAPGCIQATAGLSGLIANPKSGQVRRGGKTVVWGWITSTGTKEASGVKVCASVPKSLVSVVGKRCQSIGSLAPGKTAKTKFTVKVKGKAKRNSKAKIKLVASAGDGLGNRTATVRLTVR